jgi:xanthine dehydrogenase YagS FAD-binding subunit
VWLGSVAPTPHRAPEAEALLEAGAVDASRAAKAGAAAAAVATPLAGNRYKLNLVEVVVARAALAAAGRLR